MYTIIFIGNIFGDTGFKYRTDKMDISPHFTRRATPEHEEATCSDSILEHQMTIDDH